MNSLFEYLPPIFREFAEFQGVFDAVQQELSLMRQELRNLEQELWLDTASLAGLQKMAAAQRLSEPYEEESLLRARLYLHFAETPPYSLRRIRRMIASVLGEDGFVLQSDSDRAVCTLTLPERNGGYARILGDFLDRVVPANMVLCVKEQKADGTETVRYIP